MDNLTPSLTVKPAANPPRDRILAAWHKQFIARADSGNSWFVDTSDAKRNVLERNFCAIYEGDTRRNEIEPALDPRRLLFGKLQCFFYCGPRGQYQLNRTVDLSDLEQNSLGPFATPDEEIDVPATG